MFDELEKKHGINAEQAFGIYDNKDSGYATVDEFKKVMKIFFAESVKEQTDVDFIIRMS
jgi:hypothetical protein